MSLRITRVDRVGLFQWRVVYITPGEGMATETTHISRRLAERAARRWRFA